MAKKPPESDGDAERNRFDLRLDPEIRERLETQAKRFGLKLSPYIRLALMQKLEQDEATDPNRESS